MSKLVYISGPYTAYTKLEIEGNINNARSVAMWLVKHRIFYHCPHLNSAHFDQWLEDVPVSFYYAMDEEILSRCDAILILPRWQQSKGTIAEIEYCVKHHVPCFYYPKDIDKLLSWHREEKP